MAALITFTCLKCGYSVDSWDDGNPYIEAPDGTRHHFYHPCEDEQIRSIVEKILGHSPSRQESEEYLRLHGGNEGNFICRDCREISKRDDEKDKMVCSACGSKRLVETHRLGGRRCLACKDGRFNKGKMTGVS